MDKTGKEQLDETHEKALKLKEKEKTLTQKYNAQLRKERNHRLIEIGGLVEAIYGGPIGDDKLSKLGKFLRQQEARGRYFSRALDEGDEGENSNV